MAAKKKEISTFTTDDSIELTVEDTKEISTEAVQVEVIETDVQEALAAAEEAAKKAEKEAADELAKLEEEAKAEVARVLEAAKAEEVRLASAVASMEATLAEDFNKFHMS